MLLIWYSPGLRRYDRLFALLSVYMHRIDDNSSIHKEMIMMMIVMKMIMMIMMMSISILSTDN